MTEFEPIILHRVKNDLMQWSIEHGVVVPALCGFPTMVTPPAEMVSHMVNDRLELECPICADLYSALSTGRPATNAV